MADGELSSFLESGLYRFDNANAVFIDPVRVLNRFYTRRFTVSPSAYYSRFFLQTPPGPEPSNKRKRGKKKVRQHLNPRELIADKRHQEVRLELLKAHEALIGANNLLVELNNLRYFGVDCGGGESSELDFVKLGSVWQAPFYEIYVNKAENSGGAEPCHQTPVPVFDNLVANDGSNETEAEFLGHNYILPKKSCFYMSDLTQIHNLIPAEPDCGFNLIVIDPPWENGSARQKLKYQTLPNRYFLSLPIVQLSHTDGALVALWVTNREKLRSFVENELFPKWGVKYTATFYWLKVKTDGSLIGELDLFHHRPYECLLLGFTHRKEINTEQLLRQKNIPNNRVLISVPGDYSRKPPIGELLGDYVPGTKPGRCIELFSREMMAGWVSWGNEPLHFQDSRYFLGRTDVNV